MTPHFRAFTYCFAVVLLALAILVSLSGCILICPECYPEPRPAQKAPRVPFKCDGITCAKLDRKDAIKWLERNTPAGTER
jgi:hypothetical protein